MTDASRPDGPTEALPAHIESTIRAIAEMDARHQLRSTPSQRAFSLMAKLVARPRFLGVLTLFLAAWMAWNLAAGRLGLAAWDPPPFNWLQGLVAAAALYMTTIILIAQKREDELASLREQLTLELAILSEQKSAKIIELLERLRLDLPSVPNRLDPEAAAMARPADPQSVVDKIIESHEAVILDALDERTAEPASPPA